MSDDLRRAVEDLWERREAGEVETGEEGALATLDAFLDALEAGEVRAADPVDGAGGSDAGREWQANAWVKRGVLLNFALRSIEAREYGGVVYNDVLPLADTAGYADRGTRNTPDGTVVRRGASIGDDCILMSPCFVNAGARVGDGSLVDSCTTVGSCARVGTDVKLGANTLVGGVLEPVEDAPVVIEDGVTLGAGCRVTSGFVVGEGTVVAENTLLTPRIPVYDLVDETVRFGELPPERRAFTRYVPSSLGDHDLFEDGAYKPAVVATDIEETTVEATEREQMLRESEAGGDEG
ncbi:2,3,4,5-tetrahydropyridine-2,6-dicarboxylate N-succinyltransferase [Halobacteriales archaeon QS_1_68_20]|nr:MAG: 2,3,4,5-tetrahydropyridine-2,6-dicarboxylate N-succinyltransferase [Halobacteriales archaeon QS_1_68_20]